MTNISVVIPVRDDERIFSCLESVYKFMPEHTEVIVVDDCSTQINIKKISSTFPGCQYIQLDSHKGPAYARNIGVQRSLGEYIFFIDSDAQVQEKTLSGILLKFQSNPKIDAITVPYDAETNSEQFFSVFRALEVNYSIINYFTNSFGSNGSAIKRKVFLDVGGFDSNYILAHAEDFELGLRLVSLNYNVMIDKENSILNSYPKYFLFDGLKKYSTRAFLRAIVTLNYGVRLNTTYNSPIFKIMYILALFSFLFLLLIPFSKLFVPITLVLYSIFFYLNSSLYQFFYKKRGPIFAIRAVLMHGIFILTITLSGSLGIMFLYFNKVRKTFAY